MTSTEYQQLVEFLGHQFTEIGHQFTEVDRRFTQMGHRFDAMDRRFDAMDHQFVELRQETLGHFDTIYHRFERLEQEYHAITQALRRIEARLADEHGRREVLERALAELKQRL